MSDTFTEQELADFLAGYIECGLWADLDGICPHCAHKAMDEIGEHERRVCVNPDCREYGEQVSIEFGAGNEWPEWIDELADETREKMRAECADFLFANYADLRAYCEHPDTIARSERCNDGSNPHRWRTPDTTYG